MILYDAGITVSMVPFGILIPVRDSRATRTFEALAADPSLSSSITRWHCGTVNERLSREDLARAHAQAYVERLHSWALTDEIIATYELIDERGHYHRYDPDQARRPLAELFGRILVKAAGTLQCARIAQRSGFCFYFSGGMHHAHSDHGSGFCLVNDIVIAARKLQAEGAADTIWVIDVDAHKGDGTAAITHGDESIKTLSIHMAEGWPLDGPERLADGTANPVFIPSDIDIPIQSGQEGSYVERLRQGLDHLAAGPAPALAIVVDGADPYEKDELPSTARLRLSLDQMMARDRLVYSFLKSRNIPAAFLMAGGYGDHVWEVYARFLTWALTQHSSP